MIHLLSAEHFSEFCDPSRPYSYDGVAARWAGPGALIAPGRRAQQQQQPASSAQRLYSIAAPLHSGVTPFRSPTPCIEQCEAASQDPPRSSCRPPMPEGSSAFARFAGSSVAAVIAETATLPTDVAKTRMQVDSGAD
jgi:hypothetical protein